MRTDPDMALALLDQKHAGKKLLLVTNSEWFYVVEMMKFTLDRFLPEGMTFRDVFDVVIVGARKPEFFSSKNPLFEVASEDGLLRPVVGPMAGGKAYFGGNAGAVEAFLGCSGTRSACRRPHLRGCPDIEERPAVADGARLVGAGAGGRSGDRAAGERGATLRVDGREGARRRPRVQAEARSPAAPRGLRAQARHDHGGSSTPSLPRRGTSSWRWIRSSRRSRTR